MEFDREERERVEAVLSAIDEFGEIFHREGGPEPGRERQELPSPEEFAYETTEEEIETNDVFVVAQLETEPFSAVYSFPRYSDQVIARYHIDHMLDGMRIGEKLGFQSTAPEYLSKALDDYEAISEFGNKKHMLQMSIEPENSEEEVLDQLQTAKDKAYESIRKTANMYDVRVEVA